MKIEALDDTRAVLGESPIWHRASGCVAWLDLLRPSLYLHDPASHRTVVREIDLPAPLGAIVATDDPDRLIVSARNGLSVITLAGEVEGLLVDPERGRDEIAYNDCKVDRFGRLWIGTHHLPERDPRGALWAYSGHGMPQLADAGFAVSNGPAVSPDGRLLYFNDSVGRKTFVYGIDAADPLPRNRRVFASYVPEEGLPDGMTVDEEGGVWVAHWGGGRVTCFTAEGQVSLTIRLPCPNVTSVAFAGEALDRLVITTAQDGMTAEELAACAEAGRTFVCSPGYRGVADPLFPLNALNLRVQEEKAQRSAHSG